PAQPQPQPQPQPQSQSQSQSQPQSQSQSPTNGGAAKPAQAQTAQISTPAGEDGGYVTPLVRKLASEHGVDLSSLSGTGVGGRIRKQDVLDAAEQQKAAAAAPPPAAPAPAAAPAAAKAEPSP